MSLIGPPPSYRKMFMILTIILHGRGQLGFGSPEPLKWKTEMDVWL